MGTVRPLLPCPFCGNELRIRSGLNGYGKCVTENCFGARLQIVPFDDLRQVVEWNTRAAPSAIKPESAVAPTPTLPCPDCNERPSAKGGLYAAALDRCYAGRCGRNIDADNPRSKMLDHVDKI